MSATITDVIFDYCDVLLDWRPRIPLEGQYPSGVIDMFFSADDPHGFRYYDRSRTRVGTRSASSPITRSSTGRPWPGCSASTSSGNGLRSPGCSRARGSCCGSSDASGVRLWGLTNFTTKYVRAAHELFPELNLLRDTVVSSEEGILKPDPRSTAGPSPGSASTPRIRCSWMTSRPMWRRPGDWGPGSTGRCLGEWIVCGVRTTLMFPDRPKALQEFNHRTLR